MAITIAGEDKDTTLRFEPVNKNYRVTGKEMNILSDFDLVKGKNYIDVKFEADIRIRIRRIVIRIRIRHTAIRVRVVVPAIDHTAYWVALPTAKLLNICAKRDKIVRCYEFWNETL